MQAKISCKASNDDYNNLQKTYKKGWRELNDRTNGLNAKEADIKTRLSACDSREKSLKDIESKLDERKKEFGDQAIKWESRIAHVVEYEDNSAALERTLLKMCGLEERLEHEKREKPMAQDRAIKAEKKIAELEEMVDQLKIRVQVGDGLSEGASTPRSSSYSEVSASASICSGFATPSSSSSSHFIVTAKHLPVAGCNADMIALLKQTALDDEAYNEMLRERVRKAEDELERNVKRTQAHEKILEICEGLHQHLRIDEMAEERLKELGLGEVD